MYITLETDYAIRIVSCIAKSKDRIEAKDLARLACVTYRFLLKITRKLCAAGILKSYKGAKGGYTLAKSPAEISLCDIIEAIEGQYRFSRCLEPQHACNRDMSGRCPFQSAFSEITDKVRDMLKSYTIEDLNKIDVT